VTTTPKHRWYQFSLKTLLVGLTVLCIGPGGYVAYEQRKAKREEEAVFAVEENGGVVYRDPAVPVRTAMLRQILGDDSFARVDEVRFFGTHETDAGLVHLADLTKLESLYLSRTHVTDEGLRHVARLKGLKVLVLSDTPTSDDGLAHLAGMVNLQTLWLAFTHVSDAGLVHLAGLRGLTDLSLARTQVTDSGLVHLAGLTKLKSLHLGETQVTDAGIAELQKALPNCEIFR